MNGVWRVGARPLKGAVGPQGDYGADDGHVNEGAEKYDYVNRAPSAGPGGGCARFWHDFRLIEEPWFVNARAVRAVEGLWMEKKTGAAGPALFITVLVAIIWFLYWFLGHG